MNQSGTYLAGVQELEDIKRNLVDDIESFSLQPPAARVITYLMRLLPPDCVAPTRLGDARRQDGAGT